MQLHELPDHIQRLIAQYAHPIHPCKQSIDRFRWMVTPFADRLDHDEPRDWSAMWTQDEFKQYEHWNTRMHRNDIRACEEWLEDTPQSITNHTDRTLLQFRIAEQNYTFRAFMAEHLRNESMRDLMYSVPGSLTELMSILNEATYVSGYHMAESN